jgi:hypothetical protein
MSAHIVRLSELRRQCRAALFRGLELSLFVVDEGEIIEDGGLGH